MAQAIDHAMATFLDTAADDLQRQMGIAGAVVVVAADGLPEGIALTATLRVGQQTIEVRADGENVLTAYAGLRERVLERDTPPSLCIDDPMLPEERCIYVEADPAALFPISRGVRAWSDGVFDGSVRLHGDPALIRKMSKWFLPAAA